MRTILSVLALLLISMPQAIQAAASSRPNIIFILTDDQRQDSLACYGNKTVKTPNIDRLAADGTLFEQAFVTSAICTPSRASYFLGQYERRHGVNFNSGTAMAPKAWAKSYPVLLREAGYFTGYIGKNHVPVGPRGYQSDILEKSFDFWYAGHGHLSFYPKKVHPIFRQAKADTQIEILEEGALSFLDHRGSFIAGSEAFLKERPTDKPFCLSICFNLPHAASTSTMKLLPSDPELYRTGYRDQINTFPLPNHYVAKADIKSPKIPADVLYTQYRQKSYSYVETEVDLRERMVREYETITGIDQLVGAVRAQLKTEGLDKNTVIIFSSDHGITHGEYGLGGKALNYENCLRIPMIVMDPRKSGSKQQGQRLQQLVQSIDIAPTMLDLAGVLAPDTMQGKSLMPLVNGQKVKWREYAFGENLWSTVFGNPRIESARSAEWKYIRYFASDRKLFGSTEGQAAYGVTPAQAQAYRNWLTASVRGLKPDYEELFHITKDPEESTNLAQNASYAKVLNQMRQECDKLVREAKGDLDAAPLTIPLSQGGKNKKAE